jgi:hypothetical protein
MKMILAAIAASGALIATDASAQGVNLTGPYVCIEGCLTGRPGQPAFVTQNGWSSTWSTTPVSRRGRG